MTRLAPATIGRALDALENGLGSPPAPPPTTAFEWVVYENAAYLVDDDRRAAVFAAVGRATRHDPKRLLRAPADRLLAALDGGGMKPEMRLEKLLAAATLCVERHGGDLEAFLDGLDGDAAKAERELKRYRGLGLPGARKVLLFTGRSEGVVAFESNALRVVQRLGWVDERETYDKSYRAAEETVSPAVPGGGAGKRRAHLLLRTHGKTLCRTTKPACEACPLAPTCAFAR